MIETLKPKMTFLVLWEKPMQVLWKSWTVAGTCLVQRCPGREDPASCRWELGGDAVTIFLVECSRSRKGPLCHRTGCREVHAGWRMVATITQGLTGGGCVPAVHNWMYYL